MTESLEYIQPFDPSAVVTNEGFVVYDVDSMNTRNLGTVEE